MGHFWKIPHIQGVKKLFFLQRNRTWHLTSTIKHLQCGQHYASSTHKSSYLNFSTALWEISIFIKEGKLQRTQKCLRTCLRSHSQKEEESGLKSRSSDFKAYRPIGSFYISNLNTGLFPTESDLLTISFFKGLREKAFKVFHLIFF